MSLGVTTELKAQLKQIMLLAKRRILQLQVPLRHVSNAAGSVSPGCFPLLSLRLHNIKYILR